MLGLAMSFIWDSECSKHDVHRVPVEFHILHGLLSFYPENMSLVAGEEARGKDLNLPCNMKKNVPVGCEINKAYCRATEIFGAACYTAL